MGMSVPPGQPYGFSGTQGRGGGAIVVPPNLANAGPGASLALQLPLPEVLPIPDAHEFNSLGSVATNAVQANVDIPLSPLLVIPDSNKAVIRGVSIYITNMLTSTNVTWTLVLNNAPVAGYTGLSIFPRSSPFVGNSFDAMIRLNGPTNINVVFTNADGGSYVVGAAVSGWFWPAASDVRWRNQGE